MGEMLADPEELRVQQQRAHHTVMDNMQREIVALRESVFRAASLRGKRADIAALQRRCDAAETVIAAAREVLREWNRQEDYYRPAFDNLVEGMENALFDYDLAAPSSPVAAPEGAGVRGEGR